MREEIGLTGTKFGCGIAQCGACTVHVNGQAVRSCSVTLGSVDGAEIVTIEGLSPDSQHPVQQAWLTEQVPQCGYCQSGQIMATAAYLRSNPDPTDADIDAKSHKYLPLRHLRAAAPRGASRRSADAHVSGGTAMTTMNLTRRSFITTTLTAAGGFALGIGRGPAEAATLSVRPWGDELAHPGEINAWVVINPDDSVIIRYGRAEMGQGSFTSLPQILTEELECDWALVKPEYASANRNLRDNKVYGSLATGGSRAVRETGEMVQQAGASARERLIAAAAKRWNVPASECSAAMSKVTHKSTGRTLRYGELAVEAAAIKLDKEPAIKKPDQFKFIGRRLARLDVPLKINGSAKYGIDLDVPGMVHAAIIACPVFGGTVKSVDESKIAGRHGVMQVVKLKNAVAVIADRHWRAQSALDQLPIEWEVGAAGSTDSAQFRKDYISALDQKGAEARHDGNVDVAMPTAAKVVRGDL